MCNVCVHSSGAGPAGECVGCVCACAFWGCSLTACARACTWKPEAAAAASRALFTSVFISECACVHTCLGPHSVQHCARAMCVRATRARRAHPVGCSPCRCVGVQLLARVPEGLRSPRSRAHVQCTRLMHTRAAQARAAHTCATRTRATGRLRASLCGQRGCVRAEPGGMGGDGGGVPVRCGRRRRSRAPPSGRIGAVRAAGRDAPPSPTSHRRARAPRPV